MNKIRRVVAVVVAAAMSLSLMCTAAVADQTDTTITLNKKTVYLAVGESTQLTATVSDGQGVDWASLTTSVVQVDKREKSPVFLKAEQPSRQLRRMAVPLQTAA